MDFTAFKAYDIRGKYPTEINEEFAYKLGRSYAKYLGANTVAVGRDMRLSSPLLTQAIIDGLLDEGVTVYNIDLVGTEMVYYAVFALNLDGGIMITASHNPQDFNGMKLTREQAIPISSESGLKEIAALMKIANFTKPNRQGKVINYNILDSYLTHLTGYINLDKLKPLNILVNPGNGCAGIPLRKLEQILPFTFHYIQAECDGTFPHGVPNPMLVENREKTTAAIVENNCDLGLGWDGDFDRCFCFDQHGKFIDAYYLSALLIKMILKKQPAAKILYDPRLIFNIEATIKNEGGVGVLSKSGHSFMKEKMRAFDCVFGAETSAHYYFKTFSYCDSGMIPWLLITELLSQSDSNLAQLIFEMAQNYPISGEINRSVQDADQVIRVIAEKYKQQALKISYLDGLSMEFSKYRFNLRKSNTEPLIRLNVETKGDQQLLAQKTAELLALIE